ncbi:MAG: TolB family protein, partial [Planctomycetota bacterium]
TSRAEPQALALEEYQNFAWRDDGRFVWAEHPRSLSKSCEWEAAPYWVKSWAPGEASPTTEFRSAEAWQYSSGISPACNKVVARIPTDRGLVTRLVRFSDGHGFELPDIDYGPFWSPDSRLCAIVPAAEPNTLVLVDTETEGKKELHRSPFGHVDWASFSPRAEKVAVGVSHRYLAAAVYVIDIDTKETRRVRPLTSSGLLTVRRGAVAWSPDGGTLVLAAPLHPPVRYFTKQGSTVWTVDLAQWR